MKRIIKVPEYSVKFMQFIEANINNPSFEFYENNDVIGYIRDNNRLFTVCILGKNGIAKFKEYNKAFKHLVQNI
jgi:hypothetical protein